MIKRRKTKTVKVGSVKVGGKNPISIQSMAKTNTEDVSATVKQIKALEQTGCEIVRVAVKNMSSALALDKIKAKINIPLVADIHFNYRLGLEAVARGVDALRLNPGNIYRRQEVEAVAKTARERKIPIRIGINSGSLRMPNTLMGTSKLGNYNGCSSPIYRQKAKRHLLAGRQRRQKTEKLEDLMVKSALDYIKMLESFDFYDIIVSLKASDVVTTVKANKKMAGLCDYPFHLGVTACGLPEAGVIKSALGIGALLLEGIGDTVRVSLTGTPLEEVRAARDILQSLGLRYFGPEIVACPTCGRAQIDVVKITREVKRRLNCKLFTACPPKPWRRRVNCKLPPKVAIMGCEVNGPGEARDADLGIACGKNSAVLFKKGKIVKRIPEEKILDTLISEIGF